MPGEHRPSGRIVFWKARTIHWPVQTANDCRSTAIHCRVMQNTLGRFVWFAFCILPLAGCSSADL